MAVFFVMLIFVGLIVNAKATKSFGELMAERIGLLFGYCAPCRALQGTKDFCDCRDLEPMRDCLDFYQAGIMVSGLYRALGFHVLFCDQTTYGGGWTVIQRRKDGSVNFYRNWKDYKNGFGDLKGEFWYGNDNINDLTDSLPNKASLLIDMKLTGLSSPVWAKYNSFSIGDESTNYTLHVTGFSGNTTDRFSMYNGRKFSTYDRDNDGSGSNCASVYKGAWWYVSCHASNLNGLYGFAPEWKYITWGAKNVHAVFSEIKVRRNL